MVNFSVFGFIMASLLLCSCSSALNRADEVAENAAAGISVEGEPRGVAIKLPDTVLFDFGKSDLRNGANKAIDRSAILLKRSNLPIEVNGHTDNVGGNEYNQRLSELRARKVADALIERGIDVSRITVRGFASNRPVASNDTEQGRSLNRRTEIFVDGEEVEAILGPE